MSNAVYHTKHAPMKTHATFGRSVTRACDQCRRRKSRCDGVFPCYPCIIRDLNHVCSYSKPSRATHGPEQTVLDRSKRSPPNVIQDPWSDIVYLAPGSNADKFDHERDLSSRAKHPAFTLQSSTGLPTPISPLSRLRGPLEDNSAGDGLPWPILETYVLRVLPFAPVLSLRALYSRSGTSYEQCLVSTLWAFFAVYSKTANPEFARLLACDALEVASKAAERLLDNRALANTSPAYFDSIRALTLLSHLLYGLGQTRQSREAALKAFKASEVCKGLSESSFDTTFERDILVSITVSTLAISGASIVLRLKLPELSHIPTDSTLDPVFWFQISATLFHESQVSDDEASLAKISQLLDAHLQNINALDSAKIAVTDPCMVLHHKAFILACQCLTINALIKLYERLLDATLWARRRTDGPVSTDLTPVLPLQTQTTTKPLTYLEGCKQCVRRLHLLLAESDPITACAMTPIGIQAATIPGYAALRLKKESDVVMPDFSGLIEIFKGYAKFWPAARIACDDFLSRVAEQSLEDWPVTAQC